MAGENDDEGAQGTGGNGDNGGAGASGAQGGDAGTGSGDGSGGNSTLSAEDARKIRSENRNLRQRMKDAEEERDRLKAGTQSDIEKATNQVEALTKRQSELETQNRTLRAQVVAGKVGIVDPEIAASLVDWNDAEDDSALEKQMRNILKARPYLAGNVAGGADGSAGQGGSGSGGSSQEGASTDMNTMLRRAAGVIQ